MCDDILELLCAGDLDPLLSDGGCCSYWPEADDNLFEWEAAGSSESGRGVAGETHQNRRGRHRERQIW